MSIVAIIGAGASGMVAAIEASKCHNVVLLDGNDKCGKKILLTGNGRCNYWNSDISVDMYNASSTASLEKILTGDNISATLDLLDDMGIYPRIKGGYYYPYSNQASSVREIFESRVKNSNIDLRMGFKVSRIVKDSKGFAIYSADGDEIICDKVIVATGSRAYDKTGSDGSGYTIAMSLGHTVNPPLPALTGIVSEGKFLKEWEKIRCDAKVTLIANGKSIKTDIGEIQLTAKGVSGICVFNVSGMASKCLYNGDKAELDINFMPNLDNGFYAWFDKRCASHPDMTLEMALESVFNYKLMFVLLKRANADRNMRWSAMGESQRKALCDAIEHFCIPVLHTESYDKAQVCAGGVPLEEINPDTMESNLVSGLHFAGEVLDADGRCGGYNLAFAFISGHIAGRSV